MRRRRIVILVLSAAVLVAGASLFAYAGLGWGPDADRDSYVAKNIALLETVPNFPGATLVDASSESYRLTEQPGARSAGYGTTRSYRLPPATPPIEVIRFYRRALQPEWKRITDAGSPDQHLALRRGHAYLDVFTANGMVDVTIDHNCYRFLDGGCFGP
jgi:hypothetical protein